MSITKKIRVDENGHEHILFGIDVYFFEYLLALEIDKKGLTDRDLEKKLAVEYKYKHLLVSLKTDN